MASAAARPATRRGEREEPEERRDMKSGTMIGVGLGVGAAVALAAGLWLNTFTYYEPAPPTDAVTIGGASFAVADFQGLDNASLPLRLRSCFTLADPAGAVAAGETPALTPARAPGQPDEPPAPFDAPYWFECWDAAAIDADLKAGRATVIVAGARRVGEFTFERLIAIYPDGRAYQWRRLLEPDD